MSHLELEALLYKWFKLLDGVFFMDLMTRCVPDRGNPDLPLEPLVRLVVNDGPPPDGESGLYMPDTRTLNLYKTFVERERLHTFDEFVGTLAHELCHAYFCIFAIPEEEIIMGGHSYPDEHGWAFWDLLRYINGKICTWTGKFQEELYLVVWSFLRASIELEEWARSLTVIHHEPGASVELPTNMRDPLESSQQYLAYWKGRDKADIAQCLEWWVWWREERRRS
ncbi:hypothetical protein GGR56DRAFT_628423 [Xylariaceae sp. FL0804]|nr:hypothetical protein GGR56DRAFT_628423 [Xylariaceae sp. FL0804]